jgi:hypothetical protein
MWGSLRTLARIGWGRTKGSERNGVSASSLPDSRGAALACIERLAGFVKLDTRCGSARGRRFRILRASMALCNERLAGAGTQSTLIRERARRDLSRCGSSPIGMERPTFELDASTRDCHLPCPQRAEGP